MRLTTTERIFYVHSDDFLLDLIWQSDTAIIIIHFSITDIATNLSLADKQKDG